MKKKIIWGMCTVFMTMLCLPTAAWSALLVLDAYDSGFYNHLGQHASNDQRTFIGTTIDGGGNIFTYNSYAMFDLSLLPSNVTITGASITYANRSIFNTNENAEALQLWDVGVDPAIIDLGRAAQADGLGFGTAIWNDIGSGTSYGTATIPATPDAITVALNIGAISTMNVFADGAAPFGVGSNCGSCADVNYDLVGYINAPILSIAYEVTAVPVPAAVWLFGSGLLGLIGVARRKKA